MDRKLIDQFRFFLKDTIRKRIDFSETDQNRGVAAPPIENSPKKGCTSRMAVAPLEPAVE